MGRPEQRQKEADVLEYPLPAAHRLHHPRHLVSLLQYNRTSMSEERLSSLALVATHYDHNIALDDAVDLFARLHPRRLQVVSE